MPPPATHQSGIVGWLVLFGLAVGFVAALCTWPVMVSLIVGSLVLFVVIGNAATNRSLRQMASRRTGEDIGTFAWALKRRDAPFDPWVVRATWDALKPYTVFPGGHLPLRPTDRLEDDLRIDPDDIDGEMIQEIAERAGYSLDSTRDNPMYGRVQTVGDLVKFITFQPSCDKRRANRPDS